MKTILFEVHLLFPYRRIISTPELFSMSSEEVKKILKKTIDNQLVNTQVFPLKNLDRSINEGEESSLVYNLFCKFFEKQLTEKMNSLEEKDIEMIEISFGEKLVHCFSSDLENPQNFFFVPSSWKMETIFEVNIPLDILKEEAEKYFQPEKKETINRILEMESGYEQSCLENDHLRMVAIHLLKRQNAFFRNSDFPEQMEYREDGEYKLNCDRLVWLNLS